MAPKTLIRAALLTALSLAFFPACKDSIDENAANNPPDEIVVFIESPFDESHVREGSLLEFTGSAGTIDGFLTGKRLVWRSSIDGVIGYGESFENQDLSPGTHVITLSTTSDSGRDYENSITIDVSPNPRKVASRERVERVRPRVVNDPVDGRPYIDTGTGTVVDMSTGLMWEKSPDNRRRNFVAALEYAKQLTLDGHSDWRLPTIEELKHISNIYLDRYNRNAHLGDKEYLHVAVICSVFDTAGGVYWAQDASGNVFRTKNKLYAHTVKYKYEEKYRQLVATVNKTEIDEPGFFRCVRPCNLAKWKRYLAQKN
jgi:hypothetical protein